MADRMAGGTLESKLRAMRAGGESWEAITRRLYEAHGIEVTGQTLRMWGAELGLGDSTAKQTATRSGVAVQAPS